MEEDLKSTPTASDEGPRRPRPQDLGPHPPDHKNSIRPARQRARAAMKPVDSPESVVREGARDRASKSGPSDTAKRLIPDHIRKRFVQVGHRYYFSDGAHAFTDRGGRLVTLSENMEVVKSLIAIAEARGWKAITVSGSERFRKEAWGAASVLGLKVRGYTPTEFERALFARKRDREAAATPRSMDQSVHIGVGRGANRQGVRDRPRGPITGRLVDHGAAAYRHKPGEPLSYFVKLETSEGVREIWGIDLKRALKESLTQPKIGDEVGLRAVRRDTVTVQERERDSEGKVVGQKPLEAHRNRWIVESRDFFAERAAAARTLRDPSIDPKQAARRHPELVGSYLQMHAAQIAARQFRDPQDQERFVSLVRSTLADTIARGEPLPTVRMKDKAATRVPEPSRGEEAPTR